MRQKATLADRVFSGNPPSLPAFLSQRDRYFSTA